MVVLTWQNVTAAPVMEGEMSNYEQKWNMKQLYGKC